MKNHYNLDPKPYTLKIGWLYPELMSTYGDRGNILVIQKRCEWRGIKTETVNIDQNSSVNIFTDIDLLFGGGAQDREQEMVIVDLHKRKNAIKKLIDKDIPALFVCGAPQLLGKYYEPSSGKKLEGLGIFDMETKHPGSKKDRLIGNIVAQVESKSFLISHFPARRSLGEGVSPFISVVGFENHGGKTYLGPTAKPFAKVIRGYGNNGEDGTEGVIYKNAIGSYLHGPILTKNPEIADWLIKTALKAKYKKEIELDPLDDTLENKAQTAIAKRLGIKL